MTDVRWDSLVDQLAIHKFTNIALAEAVGVSPNSIIAWKGCKSRPSPEMLERLHKVLPDLEDPPPKAGRLAPRNVPDELRCARLAAGYGYSALAQLLHLPPATIAALEAGTEPVTDDVVDRFNRRLGTAILPVAEPSLVVEAPPRRVRAPRPTPIREQPDEVPVPERAPVDLDSLQPALKAVTSDNPPASTAPAPAPSNAGRWLALLGAKPLDADEVVAVLADAGVDVLCPHRVGPALRAIREYRGMSIQDIALFVDADRTDTTATALAEIEAGGDPLLSWVVALSVVLRFAPAALVPASGGPHCCVVPAHQERVS